MTQGNHYGDQLGVDRVLLLSLPTHCHDFIMCVYDKAITI